MFVDKSDVIGVAAVVVFVIIFIIIIIIVVILESARQRGLGGTIENNNPDRIAGAVFWPDWAGVTFINQTIKRINIFYSPSL